MLKLLKYFLWVSVIFALAGGFDQLMVKLPLHAPGLKQTQQFYVDFRTRLINMVKSSPSSLPVDPADPAKSDAPNGSDAINAVIEKARTAPAKVTKKSSRYLYVDANGTLQFADSLEQVPKQYRQAAQPLAE